MREIYRVGWTRAVALLAANDSGDAWFVQSIYVPPAMRSNGHGTALLRRVCADADAEGVTLALAVQPQGGKRSLIYGELVRWYTKHGFVLLYDNVMERRPRIGGHDGAATHATTNDHKQSCVGR